MEKPIRCSVVVPAAVVVFALVGIAPPLADGATSEPEKRPNVLYVMADQHRASAMGCYGDPNVHTPRFDAFAAQGARFALATTCTPVCCPARVSLMSGLYAHHHGVLTNGTTFNPQSPCLAEVFRAAGYTTGYFGKWHLCFRPRGDWPLGFPAAGDEDDDGTDDFEKPKKEKGAGHYIHVTSQDSSGATVQKLVYKPTYVTDHAIRFIEEKSRAAAPWLMVVSWLPPHSPYSAPKDLRQHYAGPLRLSPNVPAGEANEYAREVLPDYYGMVESVDREFGRLLDTLERAGVAKNTIVCYSADHGDMLGSHGCKAKRWPYDASTRVPYLIRYPQAIRPGTVISAPFNTPDIYPTLATLAGLQAPAGLDGLDYTPLLTGRTTRAPRDYSYLEMDYGYVAWPGWRSLRTERYLYARTKDGPWLLYDMRNDPDEMKNLVQDRSAAALVQEMDARLRAVMQETGDTWDMKARNGDLRKWSSPDSHKHRSQNLGAEMPAAKNASFEAPAQPASDGQQSAGRSRGDGKR